MAADTVTEQDKHGKLHGILLDALTVQQNHDYQRDQKELLLPLICVDFHEAGGDAKQHQNGAERAQHFDTQRYEMTIDGIEQQERGARYGCRQREITGEAALQRSQLIPVIGHAAVLGGIAELVLPIL